MKTLLMFILLTVTSASVFGSKYCQYKKGSGNSLVLIIEGAFSYQTDIVKDFKNLNPDNFQAKYMILNKRSLIKSLFLEIPHKLRLPSILYVAQGNVAQVQRCIKQYYSSSSHHNFKIIGISWGASTAMRLLKRLNLDNFNKVQLMTIDPVSRGFRVLKNLFTNKSNPVMKFPYQRLDSWINFYQKDDKRTLIFGQKGNSYPEASVNIRVKTNKNGHVTILDYIFKDPYLDSLMELF